MKESITKFDLEAAFKALDELDIPVAKKGIKANKPALNEIFSRKSKLDLLMEEYYDISDNNGLNDAKEARDAEIAKAKLARIEKIVDLDAKTPEDLLTSYVGKFIIQCPQCMTLFYKSPEDVEESEDDPNTVNISEVCQHCGNESGYTLIGKVGEATPDEMDDFDTSELETEDGVETEEEDEVTEDDVLTMDVDGTDEEDSEDAADEMDLEIDLDNIEDDEAAEDEKKEESFKIGHENVLVEQLTEDSDLDTSVEDFEKLINSPEFKKPISDTAVRAMMQEFDESIDENKEQEELTEAGLGTLVKTLGKKAKQAGSKLLNKASDAIDKFADNAMTREEKADWVLLNARKDYSKLELDSKGKPEHNEANQKFKVFLVVGFKNKYSNGKLITMAPSLDNKDLIVGMEKPKVFDNYKAADDSAKGWSMRQENGPAHIYLANGIDDQKALILCQYFKGDLKNDKLEKFFETVKKDIQGASLEAKNNDNESPSQESSTSDEGSSVETKSTAASAVSQGMKIQLGDDIAEVTKVSDSRFGKALTLKYSDGNTETINVGKDATMSVVVESLDNTLNLTTFMESLDEVQENILEELISGSLIESYKNVAGFRLNECSYLDNKFSIAGTIHFTSGKTRKTSYIFTEVLKETNNKVILQGINEKLSSKSKFKLTGRAKDKTFITESFTRI